ncbi:nitrous oxide reductase family maturation protein NosD [Shewanella sp. JM162201]|uniref:Nitrous oxide reductase family maturation protein NosD n=1 Tax=Shewanella jiangmenensis TaxID=2837387 RepID=A0ABS5V0T3_9GAMM|nr:nitrous oxide reductase family maturation protein NosD [Shewanella jiangmenensis]MBT1444070.1 nitrous oxide reductase family maturation protein NosD [Shewanella jiangmenensis]
MSAARGMQARRIMFVLGLLLPFNLSAGERASGIPTATPESFKAMLAQKPATLLLDDGRYACGDTIDFPIDLIAQSPGKVLFDCDGVGSGLIIAASDITLDGIHFHGVGGSLLSLDAAVKLTPGAHRVTLANLNIEAAGYGVHAEDADFLEVQHSHIRGDASLHLLDRGDGIHLKGGRAARIAHNRIETVRDGIYLESTQGSEVIANRMNSLQYGVHTMYSQGELIALNQAENVLGGYALMSSQGLRLEENIALQASDFGVLLNVTEDTRLSGNLVKASKAQAKAGTGASLDIFSVGKGLFIYDAKSNLIENNHFIDGDVGVAIAMGAEANRFHGNVIAGNGEELRYTGTVAMDWSGGGRGNFWGGHSGLDINGDGIGDGPYRPNDRFDRLFLIYPEARTLMQSPLVMLLKSLSDALALERGEGVTDPYPLMQAPSSAVHLPEIDSSVSATLVSTKLVSATLVSASLVPATNATGGLSW